MNNVILFTNRCYPVSKDLFTTGLWAYLFPRHLLRSGWRVIVITQWTGEEGSPQLCTINEIHDRLRGISNDEVIVLPIQAEDSKGRKLINFALRAHQNADLSKLRMVRVALHAIGSFISAIALFTTGSTHTTGGGWTDPATRAAIRVSQLMKIKVALATSGWDSSIAARQFHKQTSIPWVHFYQDAWQMFLPRIARPFYGVFYDSWVLPSAAAICHCTPGWTRETMLELRRPVACVIGGYDAEYMANVEGSQFARFTIVFAGSAEIRLHGGRDPKLLFDGLSRLICENPELAGDLEILYIGWNQDVFKKRATEAGVSERLRCLGTLKPEEVIPYLKGAQLLVLMLDQTVDYNIGRLTCKVSEYIGTDRPVLLLSQSDQGRETDLIRLIRDCGLGSVAQNLDDVVITLKKLLQQYNAFGYTSRPGNGIYPLVDLSWQYQTQKLGLILDSVARGERDPIVEDLAAEYPWSGISNTKI